MKTIFKGLILIFASLTLVGATAEGEGKRSFDRQTQILTARLLIADYQKQSLSKISSHGTEAIFQMMKSNMKKYASRSQAFKDAEQYYMETLKKEYAAGAEKLLSACRSALTAQEYQALCSGGKTLDASGKKSFPDSFAKARKHLAEDQRARLFQHVYPSAEEVETSSDSQLVALLEQRFRKGIGEAVMDENSSILKQQLILPVIADARLQRKKQLEILDKTAVPAALWESAEIEAFLFSIVDSRRIGISVSGNKLYPVFPGVRKAARLRAEKMPVERVIASFPQTFPLDGYEALLKKEESKHKKASVSFKLVKKMFVSQILQLAMEKAEVPEKFQKTVHASPMVRKAAEEHFRKKIIPELSAIRKGFSEELLKKQWPELFGKWLPAMTETEKFAASGTRKLPEIGRKPEKLCSLEEAQLLLEKQLRTKFVAETARLGQQRTAVVKEYESVLAEMSRLQESNRDSVLTNWFGIGQVTLENILSCYRKHVEKNSVPPLFPSIVKELDVRSRAILQIVQMPPEKRQLKLKRTEYRMTLSGGNDRVTLVFGKWQKSFPAFAVPAQELKKELLRRMAIEGQDVVFRIRLIVSGDKIYYRTVAEVREILAEALHGQVEDRPAAENK